MRDLDVVGEFWKAGDPDRRVAGRLTFNVSSGGSLQLAGAFTEDPKRRSSDTSDVISVCIYGRSGYNKYTLFNCLKIGWRATADIVYREDYSITYILSGHHFIEDEDPKFSSANIRLRHLDDWIAPPRITDDHEFCGNTIRRLHLHFEPRQPISVQTSNGKLTLVYNDSVEHHTVPYRAEISSQCSFGVQFERPVALDRILKTLAAIKHVLTIGVDRPTPITDLWLRPIVRDTEVEKDSSVGGMMALFILWHGAERSRGEDYVLPYHMLFTFEQLGGIEAMARWFDVYEKYSTVVDTVMAGWSQPVLFDMNRFFNAVTSAEALVRIRIQKQNFNFKLELTNLCELAGSEFAQLAGNVDLWISRVIRLRNNKVVHPGIWSDSQLWPNDLYWIAESIYCLVTMCLLREMEIPNETLARFHTHRRFREVSYHVQMAIGEIPSWSAKHGDRFLKQRRSIHRWSDNET